MKRSRARAARCAALAIATLVAIAARTQAGGASPTQIPVAQTYAWPGYVIQGGAIPKDWKPQAIPYQTIGPDGRPVTMYYAPTYTFTYPVGPPMLAASPVNRPQAYGQPQYSGWNYRATGAAAPSNALPPPSVARYQPPPAPQYTPPPQQYVAAPQQPPLPDQWQSVPPPPTQWESAAATAAPAAMAGAAVMATQPATPAPPPPMTSVSTAPQMQPVSTSPQSVPLVPTQSQPPAGRSANSHLWRVVGVHDGDTITCLDENNQQQKIRMAEIDAPEIGQDFGKVSRDAMAGMVFGKTVEVVDEGKDRYGRWIGHVYVNGMDVNRQMVATGNAWHYAAYSKDQSLADLQAQAQAQKLGLWAQPNPTPPWEFRKAKK